MKSLHTGLLNLSNYNMMVVKTQLPSKQMRRTLRGGGGRRGREERCKRRRQEALTKRKGLL
jgi:hypothetical protein